MKGIERGKTEVHGASRSVCAYRSSQAQEKRINNSIKNCIQLSLGQNFLRQGEIYAGEQCL